MPYRQTASISGLIWRNITVRASETVVTRRQNKARNVVNHNTPTQRYGAVGILALQRGEDVK